MIYGDVRRLKGGFLSQTQCAQFAKLGVFWKIWPKSTLFVPNWVLFWAIWYCDGSQNPASRGIEVVEILKSTLSIPVENFLKTPPPALRFQLSNFLCCLFSRIYSKVNSTTVLLHFGPNIIKHQKGDRAIS